jgi:hypothetical protein
MQCSERLARTFSAGSMNVTVVAGLRWRATPDQVFARDKYRLRPLFMARVKRY